MPTYRYIPLRDRSTTSFVFAVRFSFDRGEWTAYCPALVGRGASATARSATVALKALNRRVWDIVIRMDEQGEPIPASVSVAPGPVVVVTTAA